MLPFARILIVDDSHAMRMIVRSMLQAAGQTNIDEAADGREALGLLSRRNYALVISDWNMEPMSGLDLLSAMRASPRWRNIPFVMATARSQKKFSSIARDHGATRYLEKPFKPADLIDCVSSVWSDTRLAA